jgi:hypothetical protein
MKKIILENIIKNIILGLVLIVSFYYIQISLNTNAIIKNDVIINNLLLVVSIMAVTACFGNFAFTYERVNCKNVWQRYLAHVTTVLLMLIIGISLELTAILTKLLIGERLIILDITLLLLYLASILYDFWDLLRATNSE